MEEPRNWYILLHDRVGNIIERNTLVRHLSTKSTPTQVLKGELLEALPEAAQPYDSTRIALAGIDRKTLRLECSTEDIARLTCEDAGLLLAISSAGSRYESYIDRNRLDFGRRISPGSQVFVKVQGVSTKGTVWYIGDLPPNLGTMFGVELFKNRGLGNTDGTFRDKRYFTCCPDSGVFVGLDKLTPLEDSDVKSRHENAQPNFSMEEPRNWYILLHDRPGNIIGRNMLVLGLSTKSTPTEVLKGELLEALPEGKQPNEGTRIALAGINRKTLRLECSTEDIARLTSEDANLLLAISSEGLRYESYIDRNCLDFGRRILPGSEVLLEVKGISKKLHGAVWYKGPLPPNLGTMFGVELIKNPGQGTSDGTYRNKRYFTCPPDSGVFVGLDKLKPYTVEDSYLENTQAILKNSVMPSFVKGKHNQRLPWKGANSELKIDQRVVTFHGDDTPIRGTVRYIGEEKQDGQVHTIVGLELDQRCGSGNGRRKGKQLFVAKRDYAAFVGIETVIPEKDFNENKDEQPERSRSRRYCHSEPSEFEIQTSGDNPHGLEVGSMVEVPMAHGIPRYGVIKWIGYVPGTKDEPVAGLELEHEQIACSDGTFNGERYFTCPAGKSFFTLLAHCRQDSRFATNSPISDEQTSKQGARRFPNEMGQQEQKRVEEEQTSQKELTEMQQQELDRARLLEQLREKEMSVIRMEQQLRMKDGQQQSLERQLREMELQLTNCHGQLRLKDEQLREKDQQLREKDQKLTEKDEQVRRKDEQLTEKDEQVQGKDEQLREKDKEQENLQNQLGEMEQQLREKEQHEENLQRQLREIGQQLTVVEEQSREREDERANLQQQNAILERQLRDKEEEVNELEISLSTIQQTISEQNRQGTSDWVIARDEIQISEKCLGRGGWGSVYEGMYCGCAIAVKQIHELILSAHNRRLFEREMNIASKCRHPCLLQFIGATNDEGSPLFVTELMETSLRELLQQQQLCVTEIAVISLDVAKVLNYLHEKKPEPIIHRDVSSANVLLWRQGDQWRGKVSDYGTANFMQHTMTVAPGAMIYSAPEALTSNQTVKVDVYSFGVLLYEMCIRELPDPKRRDEQVALVTNRALRGLVRRCLQTDPERRPSMLEIIDSLRQFNVKG